MIDPLHNFIALFPSSLHGLFREDISINWMETYLSSAYL